MSTTSSTRATARAVEAPFVLVLGALGVAVAARVAWAARGGAPVLVAPPVVVAGLVGAGVFRVWRDLAVAARVEDELAGYEGREGEVSDTFVRDAKDLIDRAASTLPSVCILVGLLGTFAGLFEALVGSRDLLATAVDAAALRAVVGAPLAGLARAFGSSAAGIVGSVVLGLSEGRFQRAADAIAVRLEVVDEKRRTLALGAQLREAVAASSGPTAEQAARDERLAQLLERVARAVEPLPAGNEALRAAIAENQGVLRDLAASVKAGAEASSAAMRDASSQTVASVQESLERGHAAMRSATEALGEAVRASATASSSLLATAAEETRRVLLDSQERTGNLVAGASSEMTRVLEASSRNTEASLERVSREVAQATAASSRELEGVVARIVESLTNTAAAQRDHLAASRDEQAGAIAKLVGAQEASLERLASANGAALDLLARATAELRAHGEALGESLRVRDEAAQRASIASLEAALGAWSKRDEERYAREEAERRARWEDDDARRAEWAGAEKLVLQSAMEIIAERLAAVADVQGRVAGIVEAASAAIERAEAHASHAAEGALAQRAEAETSFRGALQEGAKAIAETLTNETRALVGALREELVQSREALEARAGELAGAAARSEGAALERVAHLEAVAAAMTAQAGDVARAVETLAEVLRAVPLEGASPAAAGASLAETGASAAPAGAAGVQSDEDRAAFVACLEEARRWFDASQALQQKFLDEAAQLRSGGRP